MDRQITRERLERVARMYKSNEDASQVLGIRQLAENKVPARQP